MSGISGIEDNHGRLDRFKEHGGEWVTCMDCGATWAVVACLDAEEAEEVSEGDGYCEAHDRLQGGPE